MDYDVIVVGGGPAGSTVAGFLKKYRPQTRVLLLDRATHPRFHIGETLVSELNRTLYELGVYHKMDQAGFVRKYGATFIWGKDSTPWDILFGEFGQTHQETPSDLQTTWAWHVQRAKYDTILLEHVQSLGVEVQQGLGVHKLLRDQASRVIGVVTDDNTEHHARFVIDATGQQGLDRSLADREMDQRLRNVAFSTYWKDWTQQPHLQGDMTSSRAFIGSFSMGWSWAFPVRQDILSVGIVTSLDKYKALRGVDPEAFVHEAIEASPELRSILTGATLTPEPQGARVRVLSEFSYTSRSIVTPGLIRTGDAAGFVDPILSVGVFLGQTSARYLAYTLRSILDDDHKIDEARALQAYNDQVRDTLASFRELSWFFYQFNDQTEAWWANARSLVASTAFPRARSDRRAFLAFATGFAAHGSVWREPGALFDTDFFRDMYTRFVVPDDQDLPALEHLADHDVLMLIAKPTLTPSAVPLEGEGRLVPSVRVVMTIEGEASTASRMRRIHIPPSMTGIFDLLDGQHTLLQISDILAQTQNIKPAHKVALHRYVVWVANSLFDRGLVRRAAPPLEKIV